VQHAPNPSVFRFFDMFEFIRSHQRLMQLLLALLIIPPFAFFGIDGYSRISDDGTAVAKVGGLKISQEEFQNSVQAQMQRLRQMMREQFDPRLMDTPEARESILDQMVQERTIGLYAAKNNLTASSDKLRETIQAVPSLQTNGKFDPEKYKTVLATQQMSAATFEQRLKADISLQTLSEALLNTGISSNVVLKRIMDKQEEEREFQDLVFSSDAYLAKVAVTPEMLKKHYDANLKDFAVPAQVKAEYVVLSAATMAAAAQISPEKVKEFYDTNKQRFGQEEERRASHILIAAAKDASAADKAKAKAKAEEVLKAVKAAPDTFAQVAKNESQDPGSGAQGGDLGFFARGRMVKPFSDAAFALKPNEISNVVESDFGYHVIKLAEIREARVKTLDEAKPEIEAELKRVEGTRKYSESLEKFKDTAYEQPDSLKPLVDAFKVRQLTTDSFAKAAPPPQLTNPKMVDALFADEAIVKKRNTTALEVTPGVWVVARVAEGGYKSATTLTFDEAKASVEATVKRKEAKALALKDGEAKLAEAKASLDKVTFGEVKKASRGNPAALPQAAVKDFMATPVEKLPAVVGIDLGDAGYAVYRINKAAPSAASDPLQRKQAETTVARFNAESEYTAFLKGLEKTAKVERFPANIAKAAAQ
jgi:peptidyl-prolyl cis-trans isomerase D